MPVVSDHYTRSIALKNAKRHGSLIHPQDLSFLDEWYVDTDAAWKKNTRKRRGRPRREAPEQETESRPEVVEVVVVNQELHLPTAKTCLVSCSPILVHSDKELY